MERVVDATLACGQGRQPGGSGGALRLGDFEAARKAQAAVTRVGDERASEGDRGVGHRVDHRGHGGAVDL